MINKNELLYEIILSKGLGYRTKKLDRMIIKLVDRFILKFYDTNDYNRKDFKQTAVLNLCIKYKGFDEKRYSNPLAYFTEICKRSFVEEYNRVHSITNHVGSRTKRDFEYVNNYNNL